MMDTIESFSNFLKKIGAPNFLAIGIVIIVFWLILSGILRGLKKRGKDNGPEKES